MDTYVANHSPVGIEPTKKGKDMPFMGVPTNDELFDNAPDTIWEACRNWIERHTRPQRHNASWSRTELDWAATNLMYDPEIRGAMKKEYGIE